MTRPTVPIRDKSFRLPLFEDEQRKLHEVSELAGISAAQLLREFIEREHAAKVGKKRGKR